jgi:hypothetical protein
MNEQTGGSCCLSDCTEYAKQIRTLVTKFSFKWALRVATRYNGSVDGFVGTMVVLVYKLEN